MLLIKIFVELRVVAGRSRTLAGSPQAVSRRPCCAVALRENGMVRARHGRGMASVNQTRSRCVNQMGKTHSKPLAARHGRGTAWARHEHGMLCVNQPLHCRIPIYTSRAELLTAPCYDLNRSPSEWSVRNTVWVRSLYRPACVSVCVN
jgi:hypothetical protein